MIYAYLGMAAWFCMIDMLAGSVAKSPPRPVAAVLLALIWPLSIAFALLACAGLIRAYRGKEGVGDERGG